MSQEYSSQEKQGLYICLISIHGLIRGHDLELGRDADTGGQTKYVVDLARALAAHPEVERIDLVTRRVDDPSVSDDYAVPVEPLSDKARIIRIDAGPPEYIRKEQLWDHLDSFMDNLADWLRKEPRMPDLVHSHYADAGYVGARLAHQLGVPLVHTGHSLGRVKRRRLLAGGLGREGLRHAHSRDRMPSALENDRLALPVGPVPGEPSSVISLVGAVPKVIRQGAGPGDHFFPRADRLDLLGAGLDTGRGFAGGTLGCTLPRKLLSWGANAFAKTMLGLQAMDCTAGFRCYRRQVLELGGGRRLEDVEEPVAAEGHDHHEGFEGEADHAEGEGQVLVGHDASVVLTAEDRLGRVADRHRQGGEQRRLHQQVADPRPGEDRLGHDREGQRRAELRTEDRHDRDRDQLQQVTAQDRRRRRAGRGGDPRAACAL